MCVTYSIGAPLAGIFPLLYGLEFRIFISFHCLSSEDSSKGPSKPSHLRPISVTRRGWLFRCLSYEAHFSRAPMVELLCAHDDNVVWAHHERLPLIFLRWRHSVGDAERCHHTQNRVRNAHGGPKRRYRQASTAVRGLCRRHAPCQRHCVGAL